MQGCLANIGAVGVTHGRTAPAVAPTPTSAAYSTVVGLLQPTAAIVEG